MVAYAHGIGGGIDGCDSWMETVASLGLIVIAPFTSGGACETEYKDQLLSMSAARQGGKTLHPALSTADWSRTGVFGHSMGGMSVPGAAVAAGYNISAMLVRASQYSHRYAFCAHVIDALRSLATVRFAAPIRGEAVG